MDQYFDDHEIRRKGPVYELPYALGALPDTYIWQGKSKSVADWIKRTQTTGLIVIYDGNVVYEAYFQGQTPLDGLLISNCQG